MDYPKLPPVKEDKSLNLKHFPNSFYAAVFRLWEMVPAKNLADTFQTDEGAVCLAASQMGLPPQKCNPNWKKLGYITIIRSAWHILPYNQLLKLLDWTEDELAVVLKEDDFFGEKLGNFKPFCPKVEYTVLTEEQTEKLSAIKNISQKYFCNLFRGAEPFDFFENENSSLPAKTSQNIRMIYSYCGLYAGVLDNPIDLSYPDALLAMYQARGINAVWLPAVLYQLVPFPFDETYSAGWEKRISRLNELISKAKKYGIMVFLYINEPRCMPLDFFEKHPELKGSVKGRFASLCSSQKEVTDYLRYGIKTLCQNAKDLGGFFVITCSENLTHCKSRIEGSECIRCKDVPTHRLVSDVICAIYEESVKVSPSIKTIAWTWAWADYMTEEDIQKCIDALPVGVIIQSNSEDGKEFTIGGVDGFVRDYSISIPGPAPLAESIWKYAKSKGHEVSAKVQINNSWECSTLPFIPVFDLVREHMSSLKKSGVDHLMLSWTLGGYPSVNLQLATLCLEDDSEEIYDSFLKENYGADALVIKQAAKIFSDSFREFPFHIESLYKGPQNAGPSNLLYPEPSGFNATMTCYAYDDIDSWRAIYPRDVYINQLRILSEKWERGLELIKDLPDSDFKDMAYGGYCIFRSSYLQAEFTDKRDSGNSSCLASIAEEEKEIALNMYRLMTKNNLIGYEAANHYYVSKSMLAEKVVNCQYIIDELTKDK